APRTKAVRTAPGPTPTWRWSWTCSAGRVSCGTWTPGSAAWGRSASGRGRARTRRAPGGRGAGPGGGGGRGGAEGGGGGGGLGRQRAEVWEGVEKPQLLLWKSGRALDLGPEGQRLRRYEAAAERLFRSAWSKLERLRKERGEPLTYADAGHPAPAPPPAAADP